MIFGGIPKPTTVNASVNPKPSKSWALETLHREPQILNPTAKQTIPEIPAVSGGRGISCKWLKEWKFKAYRLQELGV